MTAHSRPVTFTGAGGNKLVGDVTGEDGPPVLLLHGGGQTRHAWRKTCDVIAKLGRVACAVDQRGHGDSEWVKDDAYTFPDFAADAKALANALVERTGQRPVAVGASLGGIASMLAQGTYGQVFDALVLVDITPRVNRDGVAKVQGFMREHARERFAIVACAAESGVT